MRRVILEVRLNEYAGRDLNPNVPWSPAEIARDAAECAAAGASIVHFHSRCANGEPDFAFESYRDAVAGIRAASDVLVHPTLGVNTAVGDAQARYTPIRQLVEASLRPDFVPLDMASSNMDRVDPHSGHFTSQDKVYVNSTRTLGELAVLAKADGIAPYCVIWSLPSLRQTLAMQKNGMLPARLYAAFLLTSPQSMAGHPATPKGLHAYLDFLPEGHGVEWSVLVGGMSGLDLLPLIVERGGHITIGLGDYAHPQFGQPTNAELVRKAAEAIRNSGAAVATPAEARAMLGMSKNGPRPVGAQA